MEIVKWDVLQKLQNPKKMESNHAILILNQSILCEQEVITSLWENAPLRVLVDGGSDRWLNFLEDNSIRDLKLPDFISGDFDSIQPETRNYFESKNVEMIYTPDQDETDFTKALRLAARFIKMKNLNIKLIIAVCENCGRLDQVIANLNTLHRSNEILENTPLIMLSSRNVSWIIPPGEQRIFVSDDFVQHQYACGLIPFCGPTVVTTSGLKWNLGLERRSMGSMFRTEEMVLCQLFIQPEAAYSSVSILGEEGVVQFRDLNAHVNSFQRKFVAEVRRCDEMERKIRYIEVQVNKDGVRVPDCEEIPKAPNPREIIDLEAKLEKTENEIQELSHNAVNLHNNYLELTELKHVLEKTQVFFTEPVLQQEEVSESLTRSLINDENVTSHAHRGRLGFVSGVVPRERVPSFEKMLWRISRGNVFLRQTAIENPLQDPSTGNEIYKTVFVAFFQGEELKSRVQKVCSGFHCNLYLCPNTNAERQEMLEEVRTRLEDLKLVLNQTQDHRERVLVSVARELQNWSVKVKKMKAIYHTLNMFNKDVTKKCLIGECWVPGSELTKVHNALINGGKVGGSSIPSFLNVIEAVEDPPTYNRTNKFTRGFQNVIDAYGVSSYREVNPALYTIVTFPFLFAVMFGDAGHGLILVLFAGFLIYNEKKYLKKKISNEIAAIFFGGRYIIFLMGLFSIYTGVIYNDFFSKSINIFGSSWSSDASIAELEKEAFMTLDPGKSEYSKIPYPLGIDPVWQLASANKIVFLNSFKMKLSIIFGVIHMMFGVCLSVCNHVYFRKYSSIFLEFIPQILFLSILFFYLVVLIFVKWVMYAADKKGTNGSFCAPPILVLFINMILMQSSKTKEGCEEFMFSGQKEMQTAFVFIALFCVPVLLFGKPLYIILKKNMLARLTLKRGEIIQSFELQSPNLNSPLSEKPEISGENKEGFGEVMIHQAIHTIEYILSTVSHTASYLRLWALSLAHSQLSDVLWSRMLHMGLDINSYLGVPMLFVIFAVWAFLTIAILVLMEGLSAFLHTLRLHWVEFMSKFYKGEGHGFVPFSFKNILEQESEEE